MSTKSSTPAVKSKAQQIKTLLKNGNTVGQVIAKLGKKGIKVYHSEVYRVAEMLEAA